MRYDRVIKLPLYARHGIAEVWVGDLTTQVVTWHRGPADDSYAETGSVGRDGILAPKLLPDLAIPASAILG